MVILEKLLPLCTSLNHRKVFGACSSSCLILTVIAVTYFSCSTSALAENYRIGEYDIAINHGRVIDPESRLDAIAHVGIRGGKIVKVSEEPLRGADTLDATGLVVAPGFIDLHTHSPTELGQYYQLFDGVTTALELEAGSYPVSAYAENIEEAALINYGASAGYIPIRLLLKDGIGAPHPAATPMPQNLRGIITAVKLLFMDFNKALSRTFTEPASAQERTHLSQQLNTALSAGAIGIGLPLDYISEAVNADELRMVFSVAAQRDAPVFVHIRRGVNGDPGGLREVIGLAEELGTAVHICHISHNAMKNIDLFLREIASARERGVDITTEVLPYNAGSALISSAVFSRDWQTIFDITYADVAWAATGERLTRETFEKYRKEEPTGDVIHHYLKDEWTVRALQEPGVIVVSDLLPMKTRGQFVAPHNGAFTRVLGHYGRDKNKLSLPTAIEKMTLLPAKRLERYAPAFLTKGRIQPGMDADITIFDPTHVAAQATYRAPFQEAQGLAHIIVNGSLVVRDAELVPGVFPGRRMLAPVYRN